MNLFTMRDSTVRLASLCLSVVLHAAIFQTVILQFKPHDEPFRPTFHFLGGILSSMPSGQETLTGKDTPELRSAILFGHDQPLQSGPAETDKPPAATIRQSQNKVYIKSGTEKGQQASEDKAGPANTPDIPQPTQYRPLRLRQL